MIKPENIIRGPYRKYGSQMYEIRCEECGKSYEAKIQARSLGLCSSCTRQRSRRKAIESAAKRMQAEYERGRRDGISEALTGGNDVSEMFTEMRLTWAVDQLQKYVSCNTYGHPAYCESIDCNDCEFDHNSESTVAAAGIVLRALLDKCNEEDDRK